LLIVDFGMIHVLDTQHCGRRGIIAVTALETRDGIALFDCGPESSFQTVASEMRALGFTPEDVRDVFLSHIHLDHAGAAWRFAQLGATIHVHPRGARHLVDPARLIESATRIFGDEMKKLWGEIRGVPNEKVRIAKDKTMFRAGQFEVSAIATPGHASHHNVYHWDENLFGGDVAGVRIDGGPAVPPFVPPELDVEAWLQSIAKMRALDAARLYLPHFGALDDGVASHLDALAERVQRWANWFRDEIRAGREEAELVDKFAHYESSDIRSSGVNEEIVNDYELADPSFMAVSAAIRYWRKSHPDALAEPR
jgi:glyoxylase-like metal-dependent hydrolase (beta-lactamase superfamily II)